MIYAFSTFAFDAESLELTREGRRVALEPQPARALSALVARAGDVVTREDLRHAIWGAETHVDYDRGLAYCIGQVRAVLGDSADTPRFVQTLPKRGFRFIAPVSRGAPVELTDTPTRPLAPPGRGTVPDRPASVASQAAPALHQRQTVAGMRPRPALWVAVAVSLALAASAGWWVTRASRMPVVAVSIFDNETGDAVHDGFVTGLADVVVTHLTALAPDRVGVVGNAAPLRQPRNIRNLKTLATVVEADYVVLGQLQRQDDRLRFILHFIRLSDGVHLSAQRFVRPAAEVETFEADVLAEAALVVRRFVLDPAGA